MTTETINQTLKTCVSALNKEFQSFPTLQITVAAKMVAIKTHKLKNNTKVSITFPLEEADSTDSEMESDEQDLQQPPGNRCCYANAMSVIVNLFAIISPILLLYGQGRFKQTATEMLGIQCPSVKTL